MLIIGLVVFVVIQSSNTSISGVSPSLDLVPAQAQAVVNSKPDIMPIGPIVTNSDNSFYSGFASYDPTTVYTPPTIDSVVVPGTLKPLLDVTPVEKVPEPNTADNSGASNVLAPSILHGKFKYLDV